MKLILKVTLIIAFVVSITTPLGAGKKDLVLEEKTLNAIWHFVQEFTGLTTQYPRPEVRLERIPSKEGEKLLGWADLMNNIAKIDPDYVESEHLLGVYSTIAHEFTHFLLEWNGVGACSFIVQNQLEDKIPCTHHCWMAKNKMNWKMAGGILNKFFPSMKGTKEAYKILGKYMAMDRAFFVMCSRGNLLR